MKIGGFQKNSLIDFPATIACIVFTQGCNFFCPFCHNPDLVAVQAKKDGNFLDEERILEFLEKRANLLQGVVITGGEPCLQKDLATFCEKIKALGYKVKLDTNGSDPDTVEKLIDDGLVDYIAMDLKTSPEHYHRVAPRSISGDTILATARLLLGKAPQFEFRTTCARPFVDAEDIKHIAQLIQGAPRYILQHCSKNVTVLNPAFKKEDNAFFSAEEMLELKKILEPHVKEVIIR